MDADYSAIRSYLALQGKYEFSGKKLFTDVSELDALLEVFEKMLINARPVYFIIDAFDECEEGLKQLIKLISTSLTLSSKVRWLVSSRLDDDILTKLKKLDIKNRPLQRP